MFIINLREKTNKEKNIWDKEKKRHLEVEKLKQIPRSLVLSFSATARKNLFWHHLHTFLQKWRSYKIIRKSLGSSHQLLVWILRPREDIRCRYNLFRDKTERKTKSAFRRHFSSLTTSKLPSIRVLQNFSNIQYSSPTKLGKASFRRKTKILRETTWTNLAQTEVKI